MCTSREHTNSLAAGAAPGIFVGGGGGVSNFAKVFDNLAKKKPTEGLGSSFLSAEVWYKSTSQKIIHIQVYFR